MFIVGLHWIIGRVGANLGLIMFIYIWVGQGEIYPQRKWLARDFWNERHIQNEKIQEENFFRVLNL